mgnify:CR=1 FL=1
MLYKNIKVEDISVVVYLKEEAVKDWKVNERKVLDWINKSKINAIIGVENPIEDMVHLQFLDIEDLDIELLTEVYRKAEKEFKEVKVNLYLDDYTENENNSVDLTLEEFLSLVNSQIVS